MDTNYYEPVPEPTEKKKSRGWLIGCGAGALVTICVVVFVLVGGFAGLMALFGGEPAGLVMDVAGPSSQVEVGEKFDISIELLNEGSKNINVSEIQLPNGLLANTLVTGVTHTGTIGFDYGEQTAYEYTTLGEGEEYIIEIPANSYVDLNSGNISFLTLEIDGQELDLQIPEEQALHSHLIFESQATGESDE